MSASPRKKRYFRGAKGDYPDRKILGQQVGVRVVSISPRKGNSNSVGLR